MKNYDKSPFKLDLPKIIKNEKQIVCLTKLNYKLKNTTKAIFHKTVFIDRVGNVLEQENNIFCSLENVAHKLESKITSVNGKKLFTSNSHLVLVFLLSIGEKVSVDFLINNADIPTLFDVSVTDMTLEEKSIYGQVLKELQDRDNSHILKVAQAVGAVNPDGIKGNQLPEMKKYIDALKTEKYFLKNDGGKKYKVSNGKYLGFWSSMYSYVFELETELYISDDAPITVSIGEFKYTGTVLMCEDFEIIVLLEKNVGERINSAYINVEPWKLLEMLEEKLDRVIGVHGKLAKNIVQNGPSLATKKPIEEIEKGQDAVISRVKNEPVTIVWGPPGTGKSYTMATLTRDFLREGKSVLLVSHSNVSVDSVCQKIYQQMIDNNEKDALDKGSVLRYGYIRNEDLSLNPYISSFKYAVKKNPALDKKLDDLQKRFNEVKKVKGLASKEIIELHSKIGEIRSSIRKEERNAVQNASVVATTISKVIMDKLFDDRIFDVVMFDEASMAYVPQIIAAATYAKEHFVCVGDFMQLPPIAQSEAKTTLCEDIYSYLKINVNGTPYYHPWLVMLDEQRRMHPKISDFPNYFVYHHLLKDHKSVFTGKDEIAKANPFQSEVINLVDLYGTYCAAGKNQDNSRYNILSAIISAAIAIKAEQEDRTVSIIAPYAAQTRLLRAIIQDYKDHTKSSVKCATVHQFQGSESEIILFDAVESYPGSKAGFLMGKDFHSVKRLINVAITRAQGKLITVCNSIFWENAYKQTQHALYRLQSHLKAKGNHVKHIDNSLEMLLKILGDGKTIQLYVDNKLYLDALVNDLKKAKEKIVISLPSGNLESGTEKLLFDVITEIKDKGIEVLAKTGGYPELPKHWKKYTRGTDNAIFPLIMIDDKITWYGVPQAELKLDAGKGISYKTVSHVKCRINGKYTAEMIKSLSDLEYVLADGGHHKLKPKNGEIDDLGNNEEGKDLGGLAKYVQKKRFCKDCKKPLIMTRNKNGVVILRCKDCKTTELLTKEEVNHYISMNGVVCPNDKCQITAGLGKKGIYIKCAGGHFLNPEDI